ncbi:butyrophilin subfamily 1 member A1-like isoform X3 [Girardinichthys multiradiatus]|uniref:butyrophilin subfamily 1 member A1-like isoform X3 n=1 Tax=Girardinichthys multiradiatus TaxID=208333 RepID=UPI001FABBB6A|nr:butyrophilin subfamily 1 member A1-like isoform X3 [Girardinichthys multiradiatus]
MKVTFYQLVMYFCLYFVLGMLSSKGCSCANHHLEQIVTFAGGNVILPCSLKIPNNGDMPTVEWSKEGLKPNVVFLYRNGFETFEMKNPAFEFRTSLFMREVKNGNVSLRISNVRISDEGIYQCLIIQRNRTREAKEMQLVVTALSDPRLSVDSDKNGRMTVACEATCWLPAPLMAIVDEKENNITDTVEIQGAHNTECYTVRQTATVQSHKNRVVCRVEQPQTNQSRTAEILLSVSAPWMWSDFQIAVFSVEVIASVCLFGSFVFCVWWACSKYAGKKQLPQRISSDHELMDVTCESTNLLNPPSMTDGAYNAANIIIKTLRTEVAELKSENFKKDETILKLLGKFQSTTVVTEHNPLRRSSESSLDYPQHLISSNHNTQTGKIQGPLTHLNLGNFFKMIGLKHEDQNQSASLGPGRGKHRTVRQHSCPALLVFSTSAAAVYSDEKSDFCSRITPQTNPGMNTCLVSRRHSLGLPPSFQAKHRYTPLPHLPEH